MKLFLIILAFTGMSQAAELKWENVRAAKSLDYTPYGVCERIQDYNLRNECFFYASRYNYTQVALWFCDTLTYATPTVQCMRIMGGAWLQEDAARACARITDDDLALRCGAVIRDRNYPYEQVRYCDQLQGAIETIECFRRYF